MLPVKMSSCCSCDVFRQYFAVKRVKCSATVPLFCSNYQNNSILSPGFLSQRFNNLQKAALLTSFWRHRFNDKILSKFGQQQLLMVNYACGFNQSETGKYFEWIINNITGWGFSRVKAEADNTYWDLDYLHSSPTLQIPAYYGRLIIVDSLGKENHYTFSKFNRLNMDTALWPLFMVPSESLLRGFDCI